SPFFFSLVLALPPRSTLFPYTTLFRSVAATPLDDFAESERRRGKRAGLLALVRERGLQSLDGATLLPNLAFEILDPARVSVRDVFPRRCDRSLSHCSSPC